MTLYTRGEFLRLAAAASAILGGELWPRAAQSGQADPLSPGSLLNPDLVLINGRVFTIDDDSPTAEAFAVKAGRFVAVGSNDDVGNLISAGTKVIDAAGMTVAPGFIDCHSHPASGGLSELINVNVNLGSIAAIKDALRESAVETPSDTWVTGFMYDDTKLAEGRPMTRWDLDEAVPRHPARIGHRGGHTAVYNSLAFELAGIDRDTPDPPNGRFDRNEEGELTGLVQEDAREAFARVGRARPRATREQRRDGVKLISEKMSASGLTTVHDASTGSLTPYYDAYQSGVMRCRFYTMMSSGLYRRVRDAGIRTGFGDEWLRIGGLKLIADGSASERTMRMSEAYEGRPDFYGILTMTQEELNDRIEEAHDAGFQVGVHANGDVTIDMVLKAYERAVRMNPRPRPRHRIEHCTLVNHNLLLRIRALGVIPTPFYTYVYYHGRKWRDYGEERMRWMFAHRSFLDYGIPVAGASDYTPGPFEPLMAIQSMVTRTDFEGRVWGPNQRVSVSEALRILTINGAHASFEEHLKGSITAGKLADFVVLADDPHECDPDQIKDIEVVMTVVGGKVMHPIDG